MFNEENDDDDYDYDDDDYSEITCDILKEYENDRMNSIIMFYKDKLYFEPEFIGIKNISSSYILYLIETTILPCKLYTKDHKLTIKQIKIYDNMYEDLFYSKSDINIYNSVNKKIFDKIYIN